LGRLFKEFAVTICVAILISGVVSVTLTPMLCSRFLREHKKGDDEHGRLYKVTEKGFDWLLGVYVRTLGPVLRHPRQVLVFSAVVLVATMWGFFIHSNLRWRLGPLEWLIATPGFHHWHHTLGEQRDRNFASMLPLMDWIFGTFHLPRKQWPSAYGIEAKLPDSLAGQLVYPLRPPHVTLTAPVVTNR